MRSLAAVFRITYNNGSPKGSYEIVKLTPDQDGQLTTADSGEGIPGLKVWFEEYAQTLPKGECSFIGYTISPPGAPDTWQRPLDQCPEILMDVMT